MRQKKGMFLMPRRFSLKTRLLSLLLSAAMVLMFLPASAFAAADKQVLEVHRQYIDIHIPLDGVEVIGWKPLEDCTNLTKPYDEAADCELYTEPATSYINLQPGQFMIVWPEDPHAPIIGEGKLRKLCVKVKL